MFYKAVEMLHKKENEYCVDKTLKKGELEVVLFINFYSIKVLYSFLDLNYITKVIFKQIYQLIDFIS